MREDCRHIRDWCKTSNPQDAKVDMWSLGFTIRASSRIDFGVCIQLGEVELPRVSHQFSLCHAELGIAWLQLRPRVANEDWMTCVKSVHCRPNATLSNTCEEIQMCFPPRGIWSWWFGSLHLLWRVALRQLQQDTQSHAQPTVNGCFDCTWCLRSSCFSMWIC